MFGGRLARLCAAAVVVCSVLCVIDAVPTTPATALPAPVTDLSYGPGPFETLSVYPAEIPGARLVVLVHGGGWVSNVDNYGNTPVVATDLQAAGFTVFDINYASESPELPVLPIQVYELQLATDWALANATLYNGDPNNLSLVGLSAGGDLVASLSQALPPGTVKAVVTLSGAFDFTTLIPDGLDGVTTESLAARAAFALGCRPSTCTQATEAAWSPAYHVTPTDCPGTWLLYNSADELMPLDQPDAMTSALEANGCNVTFITMPGTGHAYDYWDDVASNVVATIQADG